MTKQEKEKAEFKKHLEEARRGKKDMAESVKDGEEASRKAAMYRERRDALEQDRRDYEEFERKQAFIKRLEEARNKETTEPVKKAPEPVQILHDDFLRQCIARFLTRPEEELVYFVDQWTYAALQYLHWLEDEGFTQAQSVEILNAALERAKLNLRMFPVC